MYFASSRIWTQTPPPGLLQRSWEGKYKKDGRAPRATNSAITRRGQVRVTVRVYFLKFNVNYPRKKMRIVIQKNTIVRTINEKDKGRPGQLESQGDRRRVARNGVRRLLLPNLNSSHDRNTSWGVKWMRGSAYSTMPHHTISWLEGLIPHTQTKNNVW